MASQMPTYILYKTQRLLLSATKRKGLPDANLQAVQARAGSCEQQAGKASQMLTYILFKTKSMLLSAISREGQLDADLQAINTEHALVSNK